VHGHLELSRYKAKCRRFEAGRREHERTLVEVVGWSRQYARQALREKYSEARDGLDTEGVES
jgi:hypothetical protein